jgi:hypothetical protein
LVPATEARGAPSAFAWLNGRPPRLQAERSRVGRPAARRTAPDVSFVRAHHQPDLPVEFLLAILILVQHRMLLAVGVWLLRVTHHGIGPEAVNEPLTIAPARLRGRAI